MIDEKSMIGLKQFKNVDRRFSEAFQSNSLGAGSRRRIGRAESRFCGKMKMGWGFTTFQSLVKNPKDAKRKPLYKRGGKRQPQGGKIALT
jgi:hypothetical protein